MQSIRAVYEVVAPEGTVGYAPGFTDFMKVVAHTVVNKERSMLISRSPSMPHLRFECTNKVHALRCFEVHLENRLSGY